MITTRRAFLGTTLLATLAVGLPRFSYAQASGRTTAIRRRTFREGYRRPAPRDQDASHGIVVTERDRVAKDLQAFVAS
jgi:hypothetical protein